MARAVLARVRSVTAVLVLVVSSAAGSARGAERRCPADLAAGQPSERRDQIRAFQLAIATGTFYKELSRRGGRPRVCDIAIEGGAMRLSYTFRGNASLEASANVGAESTEQRMRIRSISMNAAMALLKRAETSAFGQDGCGIVWDKPAEEVAGEQAGTREVVYRSEVCNCQGRLIYKDKSIVGLVLGNAC